MLNNNYDQRFAQTEDELADLLQMNLGVNYPQWLYSMIKPFMGKKVLEVLACVGNETNKTISDVEQFVIPFAGCAAVVNELPVTAPDRKLVVGPPVEDTLFY